MRNYNCLYLILVFVLLGTGCASTYSKTSFWGSGYEDSKLSDNKFSVSFHANGFTTVETTKKYLYRRSAEIALENNYQYFVIEDSKQGFINGMHPLNSHVITLYKEGQQPKVAFKAEAVMCNTADKKESL